MFTSLLTEICSWQKSASHVNVSPPSVNTFQVEVVIGKILAISGRGYWSPALLWLTVANVQGKTKRMHMQFEQRRELPMGNCIHGSRQNILYCIALNVKLLLAKSCQTTTLHLTTMLQDSSSSGVNVMVQDVMQSFVTADEIETRVSTISIGMLQYLKQVMILWDKAKAKEMFII